MAVGWYPEELANGVVLTRAQDRLRNGELVSASGFRLDPGDPLRLRRGWGWSEYKDLARAGQVVRSRWLVFEQGSFLAVLMKEEKDDGWVLRLVLFKEDMSDSTEHEWRAETEPLGAAFVMRGNEYFLISESRNVVLEAPVAGGWPTIRPLGMDPTEAVLFVNASVSTQVLADFDGVREVLYQGVHKTMDETLADIYPDWSTMGQTRREAIKNLIRQQQVDLNEQKALSVELWCEDTSALVYWASEYDSTRDLQAAAGTPVYVVWGSPTSFFWRLQIGHNPAWPARPQEDPTTTFVVDLPVSVQQSDLLQYIYVKAPNTSLKNSGTDHWRIYRANAGQGGILRFVPSATLPFMQPLADGFDQGADGVARARDYVQGKAALVGGLLTEATIDTTADQTVYVDNLKESGLIDPPISYPLLAGNYGGVVKLDPYLVKPQPGASAALFQDSLVIVDATEKQVFYYSPPGDIEYQPRTGYREILAGDLADRVEDVVTVNGRLVFLKKSGLTVYNYLPIQGVAWREALVEQPLRFHGLSGRQAWTTLTIKNADTVVWLSEEGRLLASDGGQWVDIAPDWKADSTTGAVLVDDPQRYVLRLFLQSAEGSVEWDFYYHETLLKNGRTRVLGPTPLPWTVVSGATDGEGNAWVVVDKNGLFPVKLGQGFFQGQALLATRWITGQEPAQGVSVRRYGVQYQVTNGTIDTTLVGNGYNAEGGHVTGEPHTVQGLGGPGHFRAKLAHGTRGDEIQFVLTIGTFGEADWSIGPLWLDVDLMESSNA